MGVAGLGQGAAPVLPSMQMLPEIDLVAGADLNPAMRQGFSERYPGTRTYATVEQLFKDPEIDAVWISTPNKYHSSHAIAAMRHGKHVAVEKPMAVTLEQADEMIAAAKENGVKLLAAHTSSYQTPVRAMRRIALSGEMGAPRAISICSYTDWMLRPRTEEELAPEAGLGLIHRQSPHQIDVVRLLGGGRLRSIRGTTARWMKERPVPGFYTAYLEFEDGMPATILHNGYGYFMTTELYPWSGAEWRYDDDDRIAMRRAMRAGGRDEEQEKQEFRIGGRRDPTLVKEAPEPGSWSPIDLGMVIYSCERGDIRHSRFGLSIYGDDGRRELDLRPFTRLEVDLETGVTLPALTELHGAVIEGKPIYHSGEWGRATLEVTIALIRSAMERREILLERQVAMPDDYDADLHVTAAMAVAG